LQHEGESTYLVLVSYILKYSQEHSDECTGDDMISVFAPPSIQFNNIEEYWVKKGTKESKASGAKR
jgi:hypothetical protein